APGLVAPAIILSFGHSPAWATVAARSKADPAITPRRIRAETVNWVMIVILCFGCCDEVQHHGQNGCRCACPEGSIVFGFDSLQLCGSGAQRLTYRGPPRLSAAMMFSIGIRFR